MKVVLTSRFKAKVRGLDDDALTAIGSAINTAAATFGHPHLHQGRGIRRLAANVYEVRVGLAQRLIFSRTGNALEFDFAGNHDEIRAYLRNRR